MSVYFDNHNHNHNHNPAHDSPLPSAPPAPSELFHELGEDGEDGEDGLSVAASVAASVTAVSTSVPSFYVVSPSLSNTIDTDTDSDTFQFQHQGEVVQTQPQTQIESHTESHTETQIESHTETQTYDVCIPSHASPGQLLDVSIDGTVLQFYCPPNAAPGTTVQITATVPHSDSDLQPQPHSDLHSQYYEIEVPQGVPPNQPILTTVNGQSALIACPPLARPGSRVRFQMPAATTAIDSTAVDDTATDTDTTAVSATTVSNETESSKTAPTIHAIHLYQTKQKQWILLLASCHFYKTFNPM